MICPYCKVREGSKKNTHYLSDSIIRSALNHNGSSVRDKGFYFDMSTTSGSIKFNFQRSTPQQALEEGLGRPPTESEVQDAKQNPYSVDDTFCPQCEQDFTKIENGFTTKVLPKLRNSKIDKSDKLEFSEISIIRKFFLLQIWRSSICDPNFQVPTEIEERIRILLTDDNVNIKKLCQFPMSVTYLSTLGEKKNYTANRVGFTDDTNPFVILMNDFVIQYYFGSEPTIFFDFYGINNSDSYKEYVNVEEDKFTVQIKSDTERQNFNSKFTKPKLDAMLGMLRNSFVEGFAKVSNNEPTDEQFLQFLKTINEKSSEHLAYNYSAENLQRKIDDYFEDLK